MFETRDLTPDLNAARRQLRAMTGLDDPVVAWQILCDFDADRGDLAASFDGRLDEVLARLLEAQQDGCGIFVAVNDLETDGRRQPGVLNARALFLDLEGAPLPDDWPVPPAFINQYGNGHAPAYQCWWPIEASRDFQGWAAFQKLLAARFGGDARCTIVTLVGRLAGFYQQKDRDRPFRVETVDEQPGHFDVAWTLEELAAAFEFDLDGEIASQAVEPDFRFEVPPQGWNNDVDIVRAKLFLSQESNWKSTSSGEVSVFRAAANLRDLGISEDFAIELISQAIAIYPDNWPLDHIETQVHAAYQFAAGAPGALSAAGEGDGWDAPTEEPLDMPATAVDEVAHANDNQLVEVDEVDQWIGELVQIGELPEEDIPPLRWVLPKHLPAGEITMLSGEEGAGKSSLAWMLAVLVASGRGYGPFPAPAERRIVLVLSAEDDVEEIERRVAAASKAMGVDRASLSPYLLVLATRSIPLLVKDWPTGRIEHTALYEKLYHAIRRLDVGLFVADPFTKLGRGFDAGSADDREVLFWQLRNLITGDGLVTAALLTESVPHGSTGPDDSWARTAFSVEPAEDGDAVVLRCVKADYTARDISDSIFDFVPQRLANGERHPALVARGAGPATESDDPRRWPHRDALLDLVADGAPDGAPWRAAAQAAAENRLDAAMVEAFGLGEEEARRWLDRFEGADMLIRRNIRVPGSKRPVQCWILNPDYPPASG
jgi:hypothetical protein